MKQDYDYVIVGSGINSLVCGAILARSGKSVVILEREDRLGGCMRAEELFPGYIHEVLSSWYPLFMTSPAYAELANDLHARGLRFANTASPTGVVTDGEASLVFTTDHDENMRRLNELSPGEGDRYSAAMSTIFADNANLIFGLLGSEPLSWATLRMLGSEIRRRGIGETLGFFGEALTTCRTWLEANFESDLTRALIAPWVLHAGLGPDDAYSGLMAKLIIGTIEQAGMPVVEGGSTSLIDSFRRLIHDFGGKTLTGIDVASVVVASGRAVGVAIVDGTMYRARRAVIANVTPTQLYGRLLKDDQIPDSVRVRASTYRYGRSDMQVHFALSEQPQWAVPELEDVAVIHITPGLDAVSRAVSEAQRGYLPHTPTVVVGQPAILDPTRAPMGGSILWIQLQELPSKIKGDAKGEIPISNGAWSPEVRELYADRVQTILRQHILNLDEATLGRRSYSPADLAAMNVNLVGGDPYSGSCTLDQFLAWRPMPGMKNHETPVGGLYHIGASTHPGPGLGGMSGYMVASHLV